MLIVCCIRDAAADYYNTPVFLRSAGLAVRTFTQEVNRPGEDNPLYMHPNDHDLYTLGSYNPETAEFVLETPRILARGRDVKVETPHPDARQLSLVK